MRAVLLILSLLFSAVSVAQIPPPPPPEDFPLPSKPEGRNAPATEGEEQDRGDTNERERQGVKPPLPITPPQPLPDEPLVD